MKKYVLAFVLLSTVCGFAFAQQRTVERHFKMKANPKIDLDLKFGNTITVKSWSQDEVAFKAAIEINEGKLNDALDFTFNHTKGQLRIATDYDKEKIKAGRPEDCPGKGYSKYSAGSDDGNYTVCAHITYQLFVPRKTDLRVQSISGNINLVDLMGPIRAKSISGFVDLSWPSNLPAHFSLKTISGEAFTDLDKLKITNKNDHIPLVGRKIRARVGKDGPPVSLQSISGNIYLRKSDS